MTSNVTNTRSPVVDSAPIAMDAAPAPRGGVPASQTTIESAAPAAPESKSFCTSVGAFLKGLVDTVWNAVAGFFNTIKNCFVKQSSTPADVIDQSSTTSPSVTPPEQTRVSTPAPSQGPQRLPAEPSSVTSPEQTRVITPAPSQGPQRLPAEPSSVTPPEQTRVITPAPSQGPQRLPAEPPSVPPPEQTRVITPAPSQGAQRLPAEPLQGGAGPEVQQGTNTTVPPQRESMAELRDRIEEVWENAYLRARAPLQRAENYEARVKDQVKEFFHGFRNRTDFCYDGVWHQGVWHQIEVFFQQLDDQWDDQWRGEAWEGGYSTGGQLGFWATLMERFQSFRGGMISLDALVSYATGTERTLVERLERSFTLAQLHAEDALLRKPCRPQLGEGRADRDQQIRRELINRALQETSFFSSEEPMGQGVLERQRTSQRRFYSDLGPLEKSLRQGQGRSEAFQRELELRKRELEGIGPVKHTVRDRLLEDFEMLENILEKEQGVNEALQREIEIVRRDCARTL